MKSRLFNVLKVVIVAAFIIGAFVAGWSSALFINGDPFLATMFKLEPPGYRSFIDDIVGAIENTRSPEQRVLSEQQSQEQSQDADIYSTNDFDRKYAVPVMGQPSEQDEYQFKLTTDVTEFVTEKMNASEKAAFLVWLRSRFNMQEIDQLNTLLQSGLTPENSLEVYKNLRSNLKNQDYEYLLSIVDRFFIENGSQTDEWYTEQYGYVR